jgi:hypothetical protein
MSQRSSDYIGSATSTIRSTGYIEFRFKLPFKYNNFTMKTFFERLKKIRDGGNYY